jgi:hypothetical protein
MTGAVPPFPLYVIMAWAGQIFFIKLYFFREMYPVLCVPCTNILPDKWCRCHWGALVFVSLPKFLRGAEKTRCRAGPSE